MIEDGIATLLARKLRLGGRLAAFQLICLLALSYQAFAQDSARFPNPIAKFDSDTALVASPVKYILTVRRPVKTQLVYPDSLYDYAPFEFRTLAWYPTRLAGDSFCVDSAVYELLAFSSAPTLSLSLPVFYLLPEGDSLPVFADPIALQQRFLADSAAADTLMAAEQTLAVPERFNYPYWIIGISLAVGLLAIANIFLGKPAQRYFKLWVERQRHVAFIRAFDRLVVQVRQRGSAGPLEKALNLWKSYIERVENVPYTTYTTKDFSESLPDPSLTKSLQNLDKYIYGGFPPEDAPAAYSILRRTAIRIYAQKTQHLRNG